MALTTPPTSDNTVVPLPARQPPTSDKDRSTSPCQPASPLHVPQVRGGSAPLEPHASPLVPVPVGTPEPSPIPPPALLAGAPARPAPCRCACPQPRRRAGLCRCACPLLRPRSCSPGPFASPALQTCKRPLDGACPPAGNDSDRLRASNLLEDQASSQNRSKTKHGTFRAH